MYSSYTFTWTQGRKLATAVKGSTTASFTYNERGIRIAKTVNGVKHEYVVDGTKIISDCWLDSAVRHYVAYIYDAKGVIGMVYRNNSMSAGTFEYYIFEKNLQGDIVAVYDTSGIKLVSYTYDAWGNVTTNYSNGGGSTAVRYNSFRYRGYFYDEEIGLYYLNSRYYDPAIGRFLNADVIIPGTSGKLNGYNLYAYCFNNPVNMTDSDGNWPEWEKKASEFVENAREKVGNAVKYVAQIRAKVSAVINIPSTVTKIGIASTIAVFSGKATIDDVRKDIKAYNFFNDDEQACINATVFSSYNGTPVLKQDLSGGSMSICNTIFLSSNEYNIEIVKHEWGHTVQQSIMGTRRYIKRIGVPSLIGAIFDVDDYFSLPWERSADFLGGAQNGPYADNSEYRSTIYFGVSLVS